VGGGGLDTIRIKADKPKEYLHFARSLGHVLAFKLHVVQEPSPNEMVFYGHEVALHDSNKRHLRAGKVKGLGVVLDLQGLNQGSQPPKAFLHEC
jgi:hypothetical protein